jgi:cytidylate kinase
MLPIQVAIDGPAGAGKSTVAKLVAKELDIKYIDTGAMYRAVAWLLLEKAIDANDETAVVQLTESLQFTLMDTGIKVNGRHLTDEIRTGEISAIASSIASLAGVRKVLVEKQQQLAGVQSVVMDGRDVGTHILPHADVKIFLTASIDTRVKRRFSELVQRGQQPDLDVLRQEIIQRDYNDRHRPVAPLHRAPDAILVDTTELTLEQVVAQIIELCRTKWGARE